MDRDADRAQVYAVEDAWSSVLDRGGTVDFFGSYLHLPVQRRFGDLGAMQAYADHCLARCEGGLPGVTIRPRQGRRRAHYEAGADGTGVIAIPLEAKWACRESVLLHELAHHVVACDPASRTAAWHGRSFRQAMCRLTELALGPEAALLLRTGYLGAGLEVAAHVA